jgi:hypothetical protein
MPATTGVAPRLRLASRWFNLLWLLPIGSFILLGSVAAAKGLRTMPSVHRFTADYRAPTCARTAATTSAFRSGRGGSTSSICSS